MVPTYSFEEKCIKHYSSNHQILLVGEGNFSFAVSLATAFGNASNMVATSLDSREMLEIKYPTTAADNVALLRDNGCTVLHDVDATTMSRHPSLMHRKFDRIVFNFPHAGFIMREHDSYQISLHKEVVRGFMRNGREMLTSRGEIHVTHKTSHPFSQWGIVELGREVGLVLTEEVNFSIWDYPGYRNKKGSGSNCDDTFPVGQSSTFKFAEQSLPTVFVSF
ncbi:PREDICTED: uncharacterized protein At4g26485-like [Erythranthe guttata]|uniref:uncharacterized protein At4g26485-like n=1 Tax=Erythranthe guttata TaxID=4155 RepID=UPI00064D9E3D|nr:PREDICTED: uncharacterized protein At4g26485-like [Erythranthe guttata]|eukprot:XP_012848376.1 PREDICTED: uncharacterized protein At4g26485-like [Erythranthe guttata]